MASQQKISRVCVSEGHPLFFMGGGRLLMTYEPPEKRGRAIAAMQHDGHCYMLRNARSLASWNLSESVEQERSKLQQEAKSSLPPFSEWHQWDGKPRGGTFWCHELATVREWFLCSGRNPRVSLRNLVDISSLSYQCCKAMDGCSGVCRVRQLPQEAAAIQQWLVNLPLKIEWKGEGLPATSQRVFNELLRSERRSPTPAERKRILVEQDGRCYICGGIFDGPKENPRDAEFDHVSPLRMTVRGQRQVFAAACSSCHLEKSQLEGRQDRSLESHFSPHVWQSYICTQRPPPLVFENHKKDDHSDLFELDVRRCRASALAKSVYHWPIFSPYDSIVESTPGVLADFSFIELTTSKRQSSLLGHLPYLGPSWMAKPVVEWMLHVGLCGWQDIKLSLQATAHVPPTCLRQVIETMDAAWPEEQKHLQK